MKAADEDAELPGAPEAAANGNGHFNGSHQRPTANIRRLSEAHADACELLYHAAASGIDISRRVRNPILKLGPAMAGTGTVGAVAEGAFLDSYARLSQRVAPVTAVTLRATSGERESLPWWKRLLQIGRGSSAQQFSLRFGALAVFLLILIGLGEWTRTFIESVAVTQKQFEAVSQDIRSTELAKASLESQLESLASSRATPATAVVEGHLNKQQKELESRLNYLYAENRQLWGRLEGSYDTLGRIILFSRDSQELKNVVMPVGALLGGFLLPVLYGAVGTCAYILRLLYGQMGTRSFDPCHSGEFVVRIFLGMLSGITLQWLFVKDGSPVPGGITPAVLAFLGGYSVELLFSTIDRLLTAVTGRLRRSQAASRNREHPGKAPTHERTALGATKRPATSAVNTADRTPLRRRRPPERERAASSAEDDRPRV